MKKYYPTLIILFLLTGCQWNLDKVLFDQPCVKPSATITAPTGLLLTNANLTFAIANKQGEIGTVTWDFGDGSSPKTGETVTYAYTKTGPFTVKVTLTNRCKDVVTVTQAVTIDSKDAPVFTIATSNIGADRAQVTLTFSSTGKNTPINEFGLCYSLTNQDPTIADNPGKYNATGATVGTPYSTTLTGLTAGVVYYVKGYCKTDASQPIYSPVTSFTTGVDMPVINTLPVSDISVDQAKVNVQFTSKGSSVVTITEYGFCYSDTQNPPTIANNPTKMTGSGDPAMVFSQILTGLTGAKTYYVRAYAKTDRSADPIYGPVQPFTTQPEPVILTTAVTGLATQSAVLGTQVTNLNQFTPKEIGVCYSRTNNPPTIADETNTPRITSNFQASTLFNILNLGVTTKYYYRAFVILPSGAVRYGDIKDFTTPATPVAQVPTVFTYDADAAGILTDRASLSMKVTKAPTPLAEFGILFSETVSSPDVNSASTTRLKNSAADLSSFAENKDYAFATNNFSLTLKANTKYYYRAYAITQAVSGKQETGYGDAKSFTTKPVAATFTPPEVIAVAGGTFTMGTNETDPTKPFGKQDGDEGPAHTVTLTSYSIGKTEVTVKQYREFTTATGRAMPSFSGSFDDSPISNLTYDDAVAYCSWLSTKTGGKYRLPTEAEWEYAARGGNKAKGTQYAGSSTANTVSWNKTNTSGDSPSLVGKLTANELGLFDMSGNVWEIVNDWYDFDYYKKSNNTTNPEAKSTDQNSADKGTRTKRGGGFASEVRFTTVIERGQIFTSKPASTDTGFRVVLQP